VAIWAVERAYLEAWTGTAPGAPAYREFVSHWTVPEFSAYVDALAAAVDDALNGWMPPADDTLDAVAESFRAVARHEAAFWQMTFHS
jgi:thiaminase/transcriptional activator TenA